MPPINCAIFMVNIVAKTNLVQHTHEETSKPFHLLEIFRHYLLICNLTKLFLFSWKNVIGYLIWNEPRLLFIYKNICEDLSHYN